MRARALLASCLIASPLAAACYSRDRGGYCTRDDDCGGDVCAHTHECLPADQVHSVVIRWTIGGAAASAATCAGIAHLDVGYQVGADDRNRLLFSPVACEEGFFPNDKWPIDYDTAVVFALSGSGSTFQSAPIPSDAMADVTLDVQHP
jgi:hypothetical protein